LHCYNQHNGLFQLSQHLCLHQLTTWCCEGTAEERDKVHHNGAGVSGDPLQGSTEAGYMGTSW
jgi:hypothetical protein